MSKVNLIMPKMGESIMEATIIKWLKNPGEKVALDEPVLEIATDKVDSEIPSPVEGVLEEILFQENDVVEIGKTIAILKTDSTEEIKPSPAVQQNGGKQSKSEDIIDAPFLEDQVLPPREPKPVEPDKLPAENITAKKKGRFYSPLVKNIAKKEGINIHELDTIQGTGAAGRVTKRDLMAFVEGRIKLNGGQGKQEQQVAQVNLSDQEEFSQPVSRGQVEIIEMDRMRKLISEHMINSKKTSAHVTSFVEVDVTNIYNWRNGLKTEFQKKYNQKITYTPIFIEAIVKAIKDFPMINISVEGEKIIRKFDINIGMATALDSGNLIVPVIKHADHYNLIGLTKQVNELVTKARESKLKPEDIQDGTFTLTNVGTFGNLMGTPIINQPQVAILATGAIKKKPAVLETKFGDMIGIRQMMFLSLSYDHRVVDGFLGGSFLRRVADYLENFNPTQVV